MERIKGRIAQTIRLKYSLSVDEFAERIGATVNEIRSWESPTHSNTAIKYKYCHRIIILDCTLGDGSMIIEELEPEYVENLTGIDAKLIRRYTEFTQEEFASRVGVSTATVRKWEAKGEEITLKQLYRDGIKRMVERHKHDEEIPYPTDSATRSLQVRPIEDVIFDTLAVWTANMRRTGKVQIEDLAKLQADLEYMKGFIEKDAESRDQD